jgi:peptidoglycan hydrolase CwlO-like protein
MLNFFGGDFMKKALTVILIIIACFSIEGISAAVELAPRISDREIIENLAEIKATLKSFEEQFKQVEKKFEQVDKRFEQVDKRFEQVDKRFEELQTCDFFLV